MSSTGIVIAGAGARGAYEAGLLSLLLPRLLEDEQQELIVLGTSAGAINAAILSSVSDPQRAIQQMLQFWTSVDIPDLIRSVWITGPLYVSRYIAQLARLPIQLDSLLDAKPLEQTLDKRIDWRRLDRNLHGAGWIRKTGIVATRHKTGRSVVFVQGEDAVLPAPDDVDGIDYVPAFLRAPHVLASAAIPVVFQSIHIDEPAPYRGWYMDGGVRLNTPIKPALELGAEQVVVIATTPDPDIVKAALPANQGEPDVFDASGSVLRSALEDQLTEDVRTLRRINAFIAAGRKKVAHPDGNSEYRRVPNLFLGPPAPGILSAAANRMFARRYRTWPAKLTELGLLGGLLGGTTDTHGELLSFLFFDSGFHRTLIELGRQHARESLGQPGTPLPWL